MAWKNTTAATVGALVVLFAVVLSLAPLCWTGLLWMGCRWTSLVFIMTAIPVGQAPVTVYLEDGYNVDDVYSFMRRISAQRIRLHRRIFCCPRSWYHSFVSAVRCPAMFSRVLCRKEQQRGAGRTQQSSAEPPNQPFECGPGAALEDPAHAVEVVSTQAAIGDMPEPSSPIQEPLPIAEEVAGAMPRTGPSAVGSMRAHVIGHLQQMRQAACNTRARSPTEDLPGMVDIQPVTLSSFTGTRPPLCPVSSPCSAPSPDALSPVALATVAGPKYCWQATERAKGAEDRSQ